MTCGCILDRVRRCGLGCAVHSRPRRGFVQCGQCSVPQTRWYWYSRLVLISWLPDQMFSVPLGPTRESLPAALRKAFFRSRVGFRPEISFWRLCVLYFCALSLSCEAHNAAAAIGALPPTVTQSYAPRAMAAICHDRNISDNEGVACGSCVLESGCWVGRKVRMGCQYATSFTN